MIVLYCLVLPGSVYYFLYRNKENLDKDETRLIMGDVLNGI